MYNRQKAILINFIIVIIVTAIAVAAMVNLKDWVNYRESMRAMEHLSQMVLEYRKEHGSVPPESYVSDIKNELEGHLRLGTLGYRARWIDLDCPPDGILAYVEKNYHSLFLGRGYIVLRFDGQVIWMDKRKFEPLLAQQQSPLEIELQNSNKTNP